MEIVPLELICPISPVWKNPSASKTSALTKLQRNFNETSKTLTFALDFCSNQKKQSYHEYKFHHEGKGHQCWVQ